jgi:PAS domain S-box-containing protein
MPDERSTPPAAIVVLLTALAYGTVGWIALQLAIPPSHASAVYPSAGIALVAALCHGRPALLGTALGAFAVNLGLTAAREQALADGLVVALATGLGAAAQAALGAVLLRRFAGQPLTLAEPRDLLAFAVLGAAGACLVSPTVATAALAATGVVPPALVWSNWSTWWVGDTLGVLVGAPIALALVGRPRHEWAPRRRLVALPMAVALALLGVSAHTLIQGHLERVHTAFERDAWGLAERLDAELRRVQDALLAVHGAVDGRPVPTVEAFARITRPWLAQQPFIVAIGYSERVARAELPAFEARVAAAGPVPDYRVFDRAEADGGPPSRYGVVAIRHIEPLAPNRAALGVNALSIPAARRAIERAAATGETAATGGFRLTQAQGDETGIVLYRALYDAADGSAADDAARRAALRGVVFVTLRLDAMLADLFRHSPAYLHWCLLDPDPGAERARLAGPAGCEQAAPAALNFTRTRTIGPRVLQWRVESGIADVPGVGAGGGWLYSVIGLGATALLGALLLLVSGRQRRIEAAVETRTQDLQRTTLALRDSEERLRNIVDHVPIGVLHADADGRLREANPALRAMTGGAAAAPGSTLRDLAWPADRAAVQHLVDRLLAPGAGVGAVSARLRLRGAGGAAVPVQLSMSALRDAGGQARQLVAVVEDVGERERLEASERAREQAEAANRTKNEFVGRMSHELRTPLNAMLGFAQLMATDRQPALSPQQRRWAGQIQDAGWHLLNMINDTLDLSMIESGALRLQPRALDPAALLASTLPLLAGVAQARQVRLLPPRIAPGTGAMRADETRVRQVLTNLLSNAVKYNLPGGRVEVEVGATGDGFVELTVHDTGLGFTAAQAEALFQPFNRLGREGSAVEGSGIGLTLSRRLAELMGGSLTLRERVGPGACFVLRLPAAVEAPAVAAPTDAAPVDDAPPAYARRHVHYVEDNETNVLLMQGMLAQRPQVELRCSTRGLEALARLRDDPPDLILLDMHLPDIDGLELLRRLKDDDRTAGVPVLVLSADATRERVERAIAEGAAGYLPKPLDLAALLAAVDEVLAQADTRWG